MSESQAPGYGRLEARREAAAHRDGIAQEQPQEPRKKRGARQNNKTPEDIAQETRARKTKNFKYVNDLKEARSAVTDAAKSLFAKYGSGRRTEGFYEREILQTSRIEKTKRKLNSWNAYIRARLKILNDALPFGAKKYTSTSPIAEAIRDEWNGMTPAEKAAAVEGPREDLQEHRETKATARHNSNIAAFHDAQTTLSSVHENLRRLRARTGMEMALVAVRSEQDHLQEPSTFTTSDKMDEYLNLSYNTGIDEIAMRYESYVLSGVHGVLRRREDVLQDRQSKIAKIIYQKFREITGYKAKKLYYADFGKRVTRKWGVIIVNWPLRQFLPPSKIRTMAELEKLEEAWNNGTCRFRKLSPAEFEAWKSQQDAHDNGNDTGDDDDDDDDDENNGTTTRPPTIHAVTAQGGATVAITQSGPRKRRSDYQGTHQTKKRALENSDGTPVAGPSQSPAPSSRLLSQSPAPSSRLPSQSPAPSSRLPSQSPAPTSRYTFDIPAPLPRIPSHSLASSSRLSSQSPAPVSRVPSQMSGRMTAMSTGATNMSGFDVYTYNAGQSIMDPLPDPLMQALSSPSRVHGTPAPPLSAAHRSLLPPPMPGLDLPGFTFSASDLEALSQFPMAPPSGIPGLDLPGFTFPPQPMFNLTPTFNNVDLFIRQPSHMSPHDGSENIAPANEGMF